MGAERTEDIPIHFIVSTGRTGSTLLSSMLNAHPNVISISEEPFCLNLFDGYSHVMKWDDARIREFVNDFLLFSSGKLGPQFGTPEQLIEILTKNKDDLNFKKAIRLCYFAFFPEKDKTSIHALVSKELVYHTQIKRVMKMYPTAKFILLVRDPRDNIAVKIKRAIRRGSSYSLLHFVLAWQVIYSRLYENLGRYGKDRFIITKYETLVSSPENELKRISSFLNIPYNAGMLEYDEQIKAELINTEKKLSAGFINHMKRDHEGLTKKTYTDKINFWNQTLAAEQADLIWTQTGKLAELFGYTVHASFKVRKPGINFFVRKIYFLYRGVWTPIIYYNIPWSLRKLIKTIRYGKSYIQSGYKEEGFYKMKAGNAAR